MIKVYCDMCDEQIQSDFINQIELRYLDTNKIATGLGGSRAETNIKYAACNECFKAVQAFITLRQGLKTEVNS